MPTYKPLAWWDMETHEQPPSMTVHCDDETPVRTGILDASGTPLYRWPDRVPIGFHVKPRVRVKAGR